MHASYDSCALQYGGRQALAVHRAPSQRKSDILWHAGLFEHPHSTEMTFCGMQVTLLGTLTALE